MHQNLTEQTYTRPVLAQIISRHSHIVGMRTFSVFKSVLFLPFLFLNYKTNPHEEGWTAHLETTSDQVNGMSQAFYCYAATP